MLTKLLAVVASLASAVVVRDAAEFRVELARGASSIDLAADIYLMPDGSLRLVLLAADGSTHVATLRGDEPSGAGVPTMAPTTCDRGRRQLTASTRTI